MEINSSSNTQILDHKRRLKENNSKLKGIDFLQYFGGYWREKFRIFRKFWRHISYYYQWMGHVHVNGSCTCDCVTVITIIIHNIALYLTHAWMLLKRHARFFSVSQTPNKQNFNNNNKWCLPNSSHGSNQHCLKQWLSLLKFFQFNKRVFTKWKCAY